MPLKFFHALGNEQGMLTHTPTYLLTYLLDYLHTYLLTYLNMDLRIRLFTY